uniref:HTH deoR-type domain-containing protein n=1 Tax=uncultured Desulfobacterium sp. TaxID=201089 RepID=E1Y8R1_9BACT|nr:unknown protein [uncultured Desulfobacterium sp.]
MQTGQIIIASTWVAGSASISKVTATKDLRILVEAGFAEQIGQGRSARYIYSGGNR